LVSPALRTASVTARWTAQRVGHRDASATGGQVAPVQPTHDRQVLLKRLHQRGRQRRPPVLPALADPDDDLPAADVQVLDAQLKTLSQP
jgi:ribose 1,5-bisphosphokinase PhnN